MTTSTKPRQSLVRKEKRCAMRLRIAPGRLWGRYRFVRWRWRLLIAIVDLAGWSVFWPAIHLRRALKSLFLQTANWFGGTVAAETTSDRLAPRSILVIQLDHLGDGVLSLGMLRVLRTRFPAASLEVLCNRGTAALFSDCSDSEAVHVLDHTRFDRDGFTRPGHWIGALLSTAWKLRSRRYDLAIDVRGELPHALFMWLAGAKKRVGWRCGGGGFLLTDSPNYVRGRHEVLSRKALLETLGMAVADDDMMPIIFRGQSWNATDAQPDPQAGAPTLFVGSIDDSDMAGGTTHEGLACQNPSYDRGSHSPRVALHIGAGAAAKRWPLEHWVELAGRLIVDYGAQIVLVGSRDDSAAATIIAGVGRLPNVVDTTGKLSIPQLAELLAHVDLFVGGDSGPAHLAAAVQTPVVVLFSGTNDPAQWQPWGARVVVVRQPVDCSPCHQSVCPWAGHPCMTLLSPAQVIPSVRRFLGEPFVDIVQLNTSFPNQAP